MVRLVIWDAVAAYYDTIEMKLQTIWQRQSENTNIAYRRATSKVKGI